MHFTPATIPDGVASKIAPAFERFGLHDAEEWVARCKAGNAALWKFCNVWAITEVIDMQKFRICHITALAGEFDQEIIREIEYWAKSQKCDKVYFTGRKGWAKRMPDYKQIAIVMEKDLT